MNNQLSIYLFQRLNKASIRYAVLRNYKTLPKSLGDSDIDLWIHSEDVIYFYRILNETAKETNASLVSYLADEHCPKVCFANTNCGIQIDIFKGCISYQRTVMVEESVIIRNIKKHHDISVLDDQFANLIAFIKEVINNGRCEKKYMTPLYEMKDLYTTDYIRQCLTRFDTRFIDIIIEGIMGNCLEQRVQELARLGRSSLNAQSLLFHKLQKLSRLRHRPGYVISVQGTDGSGKSTIINAITPWLDESFHHGVVYNHLRPNVFPELGVLLGKRKKTNKPVVVTDPHAQKPSGFVGSLIRWGYYMLDYTIGYMKAITPFIYTKSRVFIFDRYYYDYYIDPFRSRTSLPRWILRFGEIFVPTPDLILCLGGNPSKIYERKPEISLEEVKRQTKALHKFCTRKKNAIWINTTLTLEESILTAKKAIVKMMAARFKNVNLQ